MAKLTNRELMDHFIKLFEGNKPFTPSENRMNGIKLSQLRKTVKQYIEDNNIKTERDVNEIILDCMEYSSMVNMKYRSIASLGYDVLPKSINYWKQRRKLEKEKAELTYYNQQEENYNQKQNKNVEKVIIKSYNKNKSHNTKKTPQWLNDSEW